MSFKIAVNWLIKCLTVFTRYVIIISDEGDTPKHLNNRRADQAKSKAQPEEHKPPDDTSK